MVNTKSSKSTNNNIPTMMEFSPNKQNEVCSHSKLPGKRSRTQELQHARSALESLAARSATGGSVSDLQEFTQILGSVMDVLQRIEMEDSGEDAGTASTVPETVYDDTDNETIAHHDDHDFSSISEEPRIFEPRDRCKHKNEEIEPRNECFGDILIDETDFSQGLDGYMDGFYPEVMSEVCDESFNEPITGSVVSAGFGTPKTRRSRTTASTSEESQCFYCAMHGNSGGCSGSRFCC
jgi:hypothetical protein